MTTVFTFPMQQGLDCQGESILGAQLEFFEAGTSTPLDVFSDSGQTVVLSQPVVADGCGRFVTIYLQDVAYKITYRDADNALINSVDNFIANTVASDATFGKDSIEDTVTTSGLTFDDTIATQLSTAISRYVGGAQTYKEAAGSAADIYVLEQQTGSTFRTLDDYFDGLVVEFFVTNTNTTASTVDINGLGAKSIKTVTGADPSAGEILAGSYYSMYYDGTNFILRGVSDATETLKGVVELGTQAEIFAETATGGTGATLVAGSASIKFSPTTLAAWVHFNGTGTVAIRDSYNITSITDNGTGDYTANLTNNMANTDYASWANGSNIAGAANSLARGVCNTDSQAVGSFKVYTGFTTSTGGPTPEDMPNVKAYAIGELA